MTPQVPLARTAMPCQRCRLIMKQRANVGRWLTCVWCVASSKRCKCPAAVRTRNAAQAHFSRSMPVRRRTDSPSALAWSGLGEDDGDPALEVFSNSRPPSPFIDDRHPALS